MPHSVNGIKQSEKIQNRDHPEVSGDQINSVEHNSSYVASDSAQFH